MGPRELFRGTSNRCVSHQGADKQRPYYGRAFVVFIYFTRTTRNYRHLLRTCVTRAMYARP